MGWLELQNEAVRMFDDEDLDPAELAVLDEACAEARAAFYPAFEEWKQRVDSGQAQPMPLAWPLSVAVPDRRPSNSSTPRSPCRCGPLR